MLAKNLNVREIFATNSHKTIEVELQTAKGLVRTSVPFGTSAGRHEAKTFAAEDAARKFMIVRRYFTNTEFADQQDVDLQLRTVDKTQDFREIGGNLALSISSAFFKAFALENNTELFQHASNVSKQTCSIPKPICNIIGGGKHSGKTDVQEIQFLPLHQNSFAESMTTISNAYLEVGRELGKVDPTFNFSKNIESAWTTNLVFEQVMKILSFVAKKSLLKLGIDFAASSLWDGKQYYVYRYGNKILSRMDQIKFIRDLATTYPIFYVEDPMNEDDFQGFSMLTHELQPRIVCIPSGYDIVTSSGLKDISDIKIGDKVFSHNGKFNKVERTFTRFYRGKLVEIIPYMVRLPVRLTPNHPVLVIQTPKYGNKHQKPFYKSVQIKEKLKKWIWKPKWVKASEVKINDYILFPVLNENSVLNTLKTDIYSSKIGRRPKYIPNLKLTPQFIEFCGYYVAEGTSGANKNILQFSLGLHEKKLADRISDITSNIFNLNAYVDEQPERSSLFVKIHSSILWKLFRLHFGSLAKEKRLPHWIMTLPKNLLSEFLRALWIGDGYESGLSYSTISKSLALQLFILLLRLGIVASIGEFKQPDKAFGEKIYRVDISEKYAELFSKITKLNLKRKNGKRCRNFFVHKGHLCLKIQSIKKVPFSGKVYNLKVGRANSFVCNGITTHNCGDDLYATNLERFKAGIELKASNGIIVKPNQVGTITDVMKVVEEAKKNKIVTIISHRSGETEDTLLCHLAVGLGCDYIKLGTSGERTVKINEMIRIEERL